MDKEEWANTFIKWLKEVKEDSKMPLDEKWDAEIIERNEGILIKASNPKQPLDVYVGIAGNFATLYIYPGIETATLDNPQRLKIYRDLLLLSDNWRMVKYVLAGDEDEIVIKTDLDLATLGREEFSDALAVTLLALNDLVEKLGLEDKYKEAQLLHVIEIIRKKGEEGVAKEDIVEYLIKTFGVGRDIANEIVNNVLEEKEDLGYIR